MDQKESFIDIYLTSILDKFWHGIFFSERRKYEFGLLKYT